jgi:hypothetical protein
MFLRAWRFLALVLAALALTMTSAHVLELPQKMRYDAELYAAVNTTLYRHFATVGAVYRSARSSPRPSWSPSFGTGAQRSDGLSPERPASC